MQSLKQLSLSGLIEQRPLPSAGITVTAVAEGLHSSRLVAPGDLGGPFPRVSHRPGDLPDRLTQRHTPDHQQVGT